jgi:hypothetical protein
MMHIENAIFGCAFAPLATMAISPQHIFPNILETKLWSLLIRFSFNLRIFDLLDIKLCHLNHGLADRQEVVHPFDRLEMHIDFVLHRRGKPSLGPPSIVEARFAVPCLAVTPGPTKLPARCQQFSHIRTWLDLRLKQDEPLCGRRNTDMLCASIDA